MNDEKFSLTLTIDGRKYPLTINRSEEEAFRYAAKQINTKMNQYRVAFGGPNSGMDSQDFVAMTAIQALVENFSHKDRNNTKPYDDKIHSLISEIDDYLRR